MVCLDQFWILGKYFFQLDHCHIIMIFTAVDQCLIVLANRLIDRIQLVFVGLQLVYVVFRQIVIRVHIFADHPFGQCRYNLT